MLSESEMLDLMKRFRVAYAKADRLALLDAVSDDFVWHQHSGGIEDAPLGRVLIGVDALLREIAWRSEHWTDVRYEDMQERSAGDVLVQTFTVSGKEDGQSFHAKAVDLYPVRDGRITMKDTYWKYTK